MDLHDESESTLHLKQEEKHSVTGRGVKETDVKGDGRLK